MISLKEAQLPLREQSVKPGYLSYSFLVFLYTSIFTMRCSKQIQNKKLN